MARKDRTGNRKSREQRPPVKIPELGYYLVVTDTEATERCYFQGLHKDFAQTAAVLALHPGRMLFKSIQTPIISDRRSFILAFIIFS